MFKLIRLKQYKIRSGLYTELLPILIMKIFNTNIIFLFYHKLYFLLLNLLKSKYVIYMNKNN